MKTLGLDLSLTGTGVCVLDEEDMVLSSVKSKPVGKKPIDELHRLQKIVREIEDTVVDNEDIKYVAIEGLALMAKNTTSLMQLAGLNYLVRHMLEEYRKEFIIVAPSSLKKFITGKGNAPKDHVMLELFKRYDVTILDNNEADSFALAKIASYIKKEKSPELTVPQKEVMKLISNQYK